LENHLRYVAVEGPLGVGKTTLARHLARSLRAELILENPADNPFLEDFYRQPEHMALPTQLHFLMSRRDALKDLAANVSESACRVSDFLFQKDRLFAVDVLYDRIERRAIPSEQAIASSYVARLQKAYTEMFHNYTDTPLLIVNATDIDFAQNEQDYARLLQQIKTVQAGRHYFNPAPEVA